MIKKKTDIFIEWKSGSLENNVIEYLKKANIQFELVNTAIYADIEQTHKGTLYKLIFQHLIDDIWQVCYTVENPYQLHEIFWR